MGMYGLWEERQESILESYYWDTTSREDAIIQLLNIGVDEVTAEDILAEEDEAYRVKKEQEGSSA
jgi:hypothetical protein|tara:strand:- start:2178 stop:2372 length:195 start_codon:yes stop_codon:yes gene_type:complete